MKNVNKIFLNVKKRFYIYDQDCSLGCRCVMCTHH